MPTIATMRLLGGRPCLDLVNTVDARRDRWGPDLLNSYDDLLTWAARTEVLTPDEVDDARRAAAADPGLAERVTARALVLREAIAKVIEAGIDGQPAPRSAADHIADEVEAARRHQRLTPQVRHFSWVWTGEPPLERVLHRVALDAAALLTDPELDRRVKLCPGPNCGWLFLDQTKNNRRRWCRDEGCGAQARMQRYRARNR